MARKSELIDLEMFRHLETERAVLVSLDGEKEKAVWLPLSLIEVEPSQGSRNIVTVTLPRNLAEEKGLV